MDIALQASIQLFFYEIFYEGQKVEMFFTHTRGLNGRNVVQIPSKETTTKCNFFDCGTKFKFRDNQSLHNGKNIFKDYASS